MRLRTRNAVVCLDSILACFSLADSSCPLAPTPSFAAIQPSAIVFRHKLPVLGNLTPSGNTVPYNTIRTVQRFVPSRVDSTLPAYRTENRGEGWVAVKISDEPKPEWCQRTIRPTNLPSSLLRPSLI
jgi:hypothetical protein